MTEIEQSVAADNPEATYYVLLKGILTNVKLS
jgi:hypothetical protein